MLRSPARAKDRCDRTHLLPGSELGGMLARSYVNQNILHTVVLMSNQTAIFNSKTAPVLSTQTILFYKRPSQPESESSCRRRNLMFDRYRSSVRSTLKLAQVRQTEQPRDVSRESADRPDLCTEISSDSTAGLSAVSVGLPDRLSRGIARCTRQLGHV